MVGVYIIEKFKKNLETTVNLENVRDIFIFLYKALKNIKLTLKFIFLAVVTLTQFLIIKVW